jgi:hypothetical protein
VWASASGEYTASGAAIGQDHNANLEVYLLGGVGDQILASTRNAGMAHTDHALLTTDGWLYTTPGPVVLEPGTSYKLAIAFGLSGSGACTGGAGLNGPALSWAVYPTPG